MASDTAQTRFDLLRLALTCFVLAGVGVTVLALNLHHTSQIGFSIEQHGENTRVVAFTSPELVVWSVLALAGIWLFQRKKYGLWPGNPAPWSRRLAAFMIDFVLLMPSTVGVVTLVPLGAEALRSGHFEWRFERDYALWQDQLVMSVGVVLFMALFLVYRAWAIRNGVQTIGGFLMRVAIVVGNREVPSWGRALKAAAWDAFELPSLTLFERLSGLGCRAVMVKSPRPD